MGEQVHGDFAVEPAAPQLQPLHVLRQLAPSILMRWSRALARAEAGPGVALAADGADCPDARAAADASVCGTRPALAAYVPQLLERLAELPRVTVNDFRGPIHASVEDALADEEVLAAVLQEYALLRRCVVEALAEGPSALEGQLEAVHAALDAELAGAVALHVAVRRRQDALLEQVASAPLGEKGLSGLLEQVLPGWAGVDSVAVYLLEEDALHLHARAGRAAGSGRAWRVGEGLVGRAASSRADARLAAPRASDADVPEGTRLALAFPVLLDAQLLVGVVQMSSRAVEAFMPVQRRVTEALARRVALAAGTRWLEQREAHVSRERRLETSLQESEERFRFVFGDAPVGIAVVDLKGRFVRTNRALQQLVGYSEEELSERTLQQLTPPEDLVREKALLRQLRQGRRRPFAVERRFLCKDGSVGWCRLTVSLGRFRSEPFIIGMVQDLTPHKRAEELQRTAEFRERFLGVLGHDLRTPLNAISLSAHRLTRLGLGTDAETSARRIVSSASRMGRMIGDVLDFARSRLGGGLPVFCSRMDLCEVARAAAEEVASANPDRPIRCELSAPVVGEWDTDRMSQVLTNLLSNALQYGPEGEEVQLKVVARGEWAELSVHNGGVPIPKEQLPELFEPFRRATTRGERQRVGNLGLGLFIVAQIVEAHGGSVFVHSAASEGTTFTVRLPRVPAQSRGQEEAAD